jgi:hypothetical protein
MGRDDHETVHFMKMNRTTRVQIDRKIEIDPNHEEDHPSSSSILACIKHTMNNNNSILSNNISSSSHASVWEEVAAILSGLIGGGLYGLKIRIPHSFGELCQIIYI